MFPYRESPVMFVQESENGCRVLIGSACSAFLFSQLSSELMFELRHDDVRSRTNVR